MLSKYFRDLDRKFTVVVAVLYGAVLLVPLFIFGWNSGWVISLLLFIFFGGLQFIWDLLSQRSREAAADREEERQRDKFSDDTKNNPTLR